MSLTSENYFELHNHNGKPILSHSLLKFAMPVHGGSAEMIAAAYDKLLVKEESKAMQLGSLLHKYVEDPTQFVWQPEWEMSDTIQLITEKLYGHVINEGNPINHSIRHYPGFVGDICSEVGWGQSWKPETRMTKLVDAAQLYWMFLIESSGKIVVHGGKLESMKGMIEAIKESEFATPLLYDPDEGIHIHRELAILWEYEGFAFKSMLDNLTINKATGIVDVWDLKSTSDNPYQFMYRYTYSGNQDKEKVERVFLSTPYVKWGYYTQEFLYRKAVAWWLKENGYDGEWKINFHFAVVGSSAPYMALAYNSNTQWMAVAEYEVEAALAECQKWINRIFNEKF